MKLDGRSWTVENSSPVFDAIPLRPQDLPAVGSRPLLSKPVPEDLPAPINVHSQWKRNMDEFRTLVARGDVQAAFTPTHVSLFSLAA